MASEKQRPPLPTGYQLRMCDADRERYGGPEWVTYADDQVIDLTFDELVAIEDAIGMSMVQLRGVEARLYTARGCRAILWIARKLAGQDDDFAEFKPNVQRLDMIPVFPDPDEPAGGDDADPPDGPTSADPSDSS